MKERESHCAWSRERLWEEREEKEERGAWSSVSGSIFFLGLGP
jgi:hypothetical protein